MPRDLAVRYRIKGKLETLSALHVGGLESGFEDMMPAVDGEGNYCVPGTGLAGAFRSWLLENRFDTDRWWGFQDKTDGHASLVTVDDALVTVPDGASVEIRDGVGIDRRTGAAAKGVKYDMVVIPRGSTLDLDLTADVPADADPDVCRRMLSFLVSALSLGSIRLGACKTRGMGRVRLVNEKGAAAISSCRLDSREGIIAFLRNQWTPEESDPSRSSDFVTIRINWSPAGPLMVKAGFGGIAVDSLPLMETCEAGRVALILPGSSIKGALRSRAEKIVRTLADLDAPADDLLRQVDVPIADLLFGAASSDGETLTEKALGVKPGAGCAAFSDCYSADTLDRRQWDSIVVSDTQESLKQKLRNKKFQAAYHVAVDRWTAEVKDKALFSVLEPHLIKWEPIEIGLNLGRIAGSEDAADACRALLLLVLRDFSSGDIPLGFAVNRGMGDIRVDRIEVSGGGMDCRIKDGAIEPTGGLDLQTLSRKWQTVVEKVKEARVEAAS